MQHRDLTPREGRFVEAFLDSGDAEQAAAAAGYAPRLAKAAGQRLLKKPAVRRAMEQAYHGRPRPRPITPQAILGELCAIAFSDFTQFVRVEDGEVRVTDSRDLDYSQRAAIAGIKDTGKGVEIKLHDKQKALELLARYLGLFDREENTDPTVRVELEGVPEDWTE